MARQNLPITTVASMQFSIQWPTSCSWLKFCTYPCYIWCMCMLRRFSHVWLCNPWTVGHHALPWNSPERITGSGLLRPSSRIFLTEWLNRALMLCLRLAGRVLYHKQLGRLAVSELSPISLPLQDPSITVPAFYHNGIASKASCLPSFTKVSLNIYFFFNYIQPPGSSCVQQH